MTETDKFAIMNQEETYMKIEIEQTKPMDIERRSFEIIEEELGDTPLLPVTEMIVKRCMTTRRIFAFPPGSQSGRWLP